jgi:hypothetical protein
MFTRQPLHRLKCLTLYAWMLTVRAVCLYVCRLCCVQRGQG